jgi:hypothetical protein
MADSDGLGDIIAQTLAAGNTAGPGAQKPQAPNAPAPAAPFGNTGPGFGGSPNTPPPAPSQGTPGPAPETETHGNFRWENVPPEQEGAYRYWQGEYTRARQKDAEERKHLEESARAYEGLSPETAQTAAMLEHLQRENPALAAQYLLEMASRLGAGQAPSAPPFAAPEPYPETLPQPDTYPEYAPDPYSTDPVERRLAAIEQYFQTQRQREAARERQEQERAWSDGLSRVQAELGRALTPQELARTANVAAHRPGLGVEEAYVLAHRKELEARYLQRGRDEALQLRQAQGSLPPPPTGAQAPNGQAHEPNWNDPMAVINFSIEQVRRGQGQ